MGDDNKSLDDLLPTLIEQLATQPCILLQAPPGLGKTTRVPLALLAAPWLMGRKIIMLEPRRIAARSAAYYMAQQLGEAVGHTVGYRIRLEHKISPKTRLEVVTEGVLTRLLQTDPVLEDYGLVIFDEFHERSLTADLGLALCRQSQQVLREDLRLLVMSATLNSERLSQLLDDAPILNATGVQYPVSVSYQPPRGDEWSHLAQVVRHTLHNEPGSILVFLPGTGEIRRVAAQLEGTLPADVQLVPLYGDLTTAQQTQAIQPAPSGHRKVVLATNIAETSLTIVGIRIVIDSGWSRVPVFDPISGMTRLDTQRISLASAVQRQGRAGRLEPGHCVRCWPEPETIRFQPERMPEILTADLAPLALELAQWGVTDPSELGWLDAPPTVAFESAQQLLQELGALDTQKRITPHGRELVRLPLHPRLAHMVILSQQHGCVGLACTLAALLSERDILGRDVGSADISLRLQALQRRSDSPLKQGAAQIAQLVGAKPAFQPLASVGLLVGLAYPERIAQQRQTLGERYLLSGGKGAILRMGDGLVRERWLAVAHLDGNPRDAQIYLAAALSAEDVMTLAHGQLQEVREVVFDNVTGQIKARQMTKLGALVWAEKTLPYDPQLWQPALLSGIRQRGLICLPWSPALLQLRARVAFLRQHLGESWPLMDDAALLAELDTWLGPFLTGVRRLDAITESVLQHALEYRIGYGSLSQLDTQAPSHWTVPTGSAIRLDYTQGLEPILAVRLQELFGAVATPSVLNQTVPVLLHLLSPAYRPVQVTQDLVSFWKNTYPEVKKELKGRYPKHHWPDDPVVATPIRGTKRANSL